jgi:hypothetical protein
MSNTDTNPPTDPPEDNGWGSSLCLNSDDELDEIQEPVQEPVHWVTCGSKRPKRPDQDMLPVNQALKALNSRQTGFELLFSPMSPKLAAVCFNNGIGVGADFMERIPSLLFRSPVCVFDTSKENQVVFRGQIAVDTSEDPTNMPRILWSPNGQYVIFYCEKAYYDAIRTEGSSCLVVDAQDGEVLFSGQFNRVHSVEFKGESVQITAQDSEGKILLESIELN